MDGMLTNLSRQRWPLVAAVALLLAPFMAATTYAGEVPMQISDTGSLVPIPVDVNADETHASVVDAQSKGTFGASMSDIVSEWTPTGLNLAPEVGAGFAAGRRYSWPGEQRK